MTTFEARAAGTDAAVWAVLTSRMQNLSAPEDINAVMIGAITSMTRMIYHTLADPGVTEAVEAIRELTCNAAIVVHKLATEAKDDAP
jgi:hypothetical protein